MPGWFAAGLPGKPATISTRKAAVSPPLLFAAGVRTGRRSRANRDFDASDDASRDERGGQFPDRRQVTEKEGVDRGSVRHPSRQRLRARGDRRRTPAPRSRPRSAPTGCATFAATPSRSRTAGSAPSASTRPRARRRSSSLGQRIDVHLPSRPRHSRLEIAGPSALSRGDPASPSSGPDARCAPRTPSRRRNRQELAATELERLFEPILAD